MSLNGFGLRGRRSATTTPYAAAPNAAHASNGTPARIATDAPAPAATIADGAITASAVLRVFRCSGRSSRLIRNSAASVHQKLLTTAVKTWVIVVASDAS